MASFEPSICTPDASADSSLNMAGSRTSDRTVSTALRHRDKAARRGASSGGGGGSSIGGGATGAAPIDVAPVVMYASDVDQQVQEIDISS